MARYMQIAYGSHGDDVVELQKLLNNHGYKLSVDGIFGKNTQTAVRDYQKKNLLSVDGIVGQNTWASLGKATSGATTNNSATKPSFEYNAYQKSDAVKQAEALLKQQLSQNPGAYQSQWQSQLNDILSKIQNREKFSYDLNGDALYQQYKDQAVLQGQQAMMDTMGQAQAMTGGYGNSYAQSVGQQAYQGHLQQLNDVVPELYQMALSKYQMEGDELNNQYALLAQQESQDYGRYRDQVSDYYAELDRLTEDARYKAETDYGRYTDGRDFAYGKYSDDRAYAYQKERDAVKDAQWQKEFDEAKRQYDQAQDSKGNTGNTGKTGNYWRDTNQKYDTLPSPTSTTNTTKIINSHMTKQEALRRGITQKEFNAMVKDWINHANLNDGEIRYLLKYYGLE